MLEKNGKKLSLRVETRDNVHAHRLQTHCQWYPMGDVRTHNSRTDSCKIFKLASEVNPVIRHV